MTALPFESDFVAYAQGLCYMSVCVEKSMPRRDIELRANLENPACSTLRWMISDDETFKGAQPNPCPCNKFPSSRKHDLLNC